MPRQYSTGARDKNESALIETARRVFGYIDVTQMREGQGFDDLIATKYGNLIVEVKMPGSYRLTACEKEKQESVRLAGGVYHIWQTDSDVLQSLTIARGMWMMKAKE